MQSGFSYASAIVDSSYAILQIKVAALRPPRDPAVYFPFSVFEVPLQQK